MLRPSIESNEISQSYAGHNIRYVILRNSYNRRQFVLHRISIEDSTRNFTHVTE